MRETNKTELTIRSLIRGSNRSITFVCRIESRRQELMSKIRKAYPQHQVINKYEVQIDSKRVRLTIAPSRLISDTLYNVWRV